MTSILRPVYFASVLLLLGLTVVHAETNNLTAGVPLTAPVLPDAGLSLLRVFGSLALVVGLFLGGVWCFRNWQRLAVYRGRTPKLNVLEVRSLGGRQALYLVGCEQQRFLLASSPAGISLITHLPDAEAPGLVSQPDFSQSLQRAITPQS